MTSRLLKVAQIAWGVNVLLLVGLYAAGAGVYYNQLRQVCDAPVEECNLSDYATPAAATQLAADGLSLEAYAFWRVGSGVLLDLLPTTLGVLIFFRKRDQPMALFTSFFLVYLGMFGQPIYILESQIPLLDWPIRVIGLLYSVMLSLFFGTFPNGRVVPRLFWAFIIFFCTISFLNEVLRIGNIVNHPLWQVASYAGWLGVLVGGAAAQIYRYARASTLAERRQMKWVLFGLALLALSILAVIGYSAIIGRDIMVGAGASRSRLIISIFQRAIFQLIPLSIGFAILRAQLLDIDLIIRRTLVYSLLTAALALAYFGCIVVLQGFFRTLTGQEQTEIVTVISTLTIAVLFTPLRRRIQAAIDRRFYRRKYNAVQTLAAFGVAARDEVDLNQLTGRLLEAVEDTMQPAHVSVWLRPVRKKEF